MNKQSSLLSALNKAFPIVSGEKIIISCKELEATLDKERFIRSILKNYQDLIEVEVYNDFLIDFDTDFSGSYNFDSNEAVFTIESRRVGSSSNFIFDFTFWYPTFKDSDEEPEQIVYEMNVDEAKAWCEYVLCVSGYGDEIFSLYHSLEKEKMECKEENMKIHEKTTASVGEISIYPNSSSEYHSVWVEDLKSRNAVAILTDCLLSISNYLQCEGSVASLPIESVYEDDSLFFSWNGKDNQLTIQFVTVKGLSEVSLSKEIAEQLAKEIEKIDEYSYLI